LQENRGRCLVHDLAPGPLVPAALAQGAMRRDCSEAFVEQAHRDLRQAGGEPSREFPRGRGGCALPARQRRGQAYDHFSHIVLGDEPHDSIHVTAVAANSFKRRSEHARWIAASHPDPHRADVDPEPHAVSHRAVGTLRWLWHSLTLRSRRSGVAYRASNRIKCRIDSIRLTRGQRRASALGNIIPAAASAAERAGGNADQCAGL